MRAVRSELRGPLRLALSAAAAALIVWHGAAAGRPELLFRLPEDAWIATVRMAEAYVVQTQESPSRSFSVRAVSVRGGRQREIVREPCAEASAAISTITDHGVYYLLTPPVLNSVQRLYVVGHDGGRRRQVLSGAGIGRIAVVGNECFWLRTDATQHRTDLMATPLPAGPTRRVFAGWSSSAFPMLVAGSDGAYWIGDQAGNGKRKLVHLRARDGGVETIPDYPGPTPPVELGSRLYWLEATGTGGPGIIQCLTGANRSGASREVLLDCAGGATIRTLGRLGAYRGRLYFALTEAASVPGRSQPLRTSFCRIDPRKSHQIERLCEIGSDLEGPGFFDGDYYYFLTRQAREQWFGWDRRRISLEPVRTLCRIRLPR